VNKNMYRLVDSRNPKCVGCIQRGRIEDGLLQRTIIRSAWDCDYRPLSYCRFADWEKWVKITEEQAMEVLLGG